MAAREATRLNPCLARNEGQTLIEHGRLCCQKGNILELARADMAFHQLIYQLSENPLIDATIAPHWHHLLRIMVVVLKNVPPVLAVWDEHAAILQAVCQGGDVTAERLAWSHGEQVAQRIVPRLS
ncbi:MAG: FCD domain-containing protein [Motiliproteus sp.]